MTALPCPIVPACGLFASAWTLSAHLVSFHSYTAEEALEKTARALEHELEGMGRELHGRTTRSWGTRGT